MKASTTLLTTLLGFIAGTVILYCGFVTGAAFSNWEEGRITYGKDTKSVYNMGECVALNEAMPYVLYAKEVQAKKSALMAYIEGQILNRPQGLRERILYDISAAFDGGREVAEARVLACITEAGIAQGSPSLGGPAGHGLTPVASPHA